MLSRAKKADTYSVYFLPVYAYVALIQITYILTAEDVSFQHNLQFSVSGKAFTTLNPESNLFDVIII